LEWNGTETKNGSQNGAVTEKNKNLENDQNITINLVTYCLVFVAKASFISFNHGF